MSRRGRYRRIMPSLIATEPPELDGEPFDNLLFIEFECDEFTSEETRRAVEARFRRSLILQRSVGNINRGTPLYRICRVAPTKLTMQLILIGVLSSVDDAQRHNQRRTVHLLLNELLCGTSTLQ